jgi:hypothetical protein
MASATGAGVTTAGFFLTTFFAFGFSAFGADTFSGQQFTMTFTVVPGAATVAAGAGVVCGATGATFGCDAGVAGTASAGAAMAFSVKPGMGPRTLPSLPIMLIKPMTAITAATRIPPPINKFLFILPSLPVLCAGTHWRYYQKKLTPKKIFALAGNAKGFCCQKTFYSPYSSRLFQKTGLKEKQIFLMSFPRRRESSVKMFLAKSSKH